MALYKRVERAPLLPQNTQLTASAASYDASAQRIDLSDPFLWPERLPPVAITATPSAPSDRRPLRTCGLPVCGCVFASTMPSLLDSPPQIPAAGAWGSLYDVQEPVKPRHVMVVPAAAIAKKPAYGGGRKKNLETCTEALGCETGAVDAAPPACNGTDDKGDAEVEEAECAERKRRAREEVEGRARQAARRPLPPPLTTLARCASRVRMVHERHDGRLAVYAVRTPGVEAERSGGRLRMRFVSLPSGSSTACRRQEPRDAEAKEEVVVEDKVVEEEECGVVAKYVRGGGRCVEPEGAAAAARRGAKQWEQEQAAARSGSPPPEQNPWISRAGLRPTG